MKHCSKCGRELPLGCFSRDRGKADGYKNQCKECVREYRKANRVRIYQKTKERHEAHPSWRKEYNSKHSYQRCMVLTVRLVKGNKLQLCCETAVSRLQEYAYVRSRPVF